MVQDMSMTDVSVGDRVQTIKGRGVVVADCDTNVVIELDGDHGTYFFWQRAYMGNC